MDGPKYLHIDYKLYEQDTCSFVANAKMYVRSLPALRVYLCQKSRLLQKRLPVYHCSTGQQKIIASIFYGHLKCWVRFIHQWTQIEWQWSILSVYCAWMICFASKIIRTNNLHHICTDAIDCHAHFSCFFACPLSTSWTPSTRFPRIRKQK